MVVCEACGAEAPDGARFCPSCAAPLTPGIDRSERKLATMIFADLVGSTALAGSQDPERTRGLMERFYVAMATEIRASGGTVEKFAGDAVMAAFGAPLSLEDHAERALHAALAMRRRLQEIGEGALDLRIGVNTGEVVAGEPHAGSSFVSGDPVNVAARLEQAARPGEILVGERTVALVRGAFEFDDPRTIDAKGKPDGVVCRRLLRALSLMRPRGVQGLHQAFVGREEEMATLRDAYEEAVDRGEPRLVTILGDAGVGKSRVVREFWGWLSERSPSPVRRTGRCLSYGDGVTYWPMAEILREHFAFAENAPDAVVREALGARPMLGVALGLDVAEGLHPLIARDRFQDEWIGFCEEVTASRPLVLLVEDIHWGEELLHDLLERLVTDVRGPLLVLVTARPEVLESRPGWGARVPGSTIVLDALSAEESARMLDELLGGGLPSALRDVVVTRAEGNPFFVEEVLGTLIDLGLLTPGHDRWTLADLPEDFRVPDTVQAVVAARVDLLEAADKQGLQAASVIGRIFWASPVYELTDGEPDLRVLEDRDFVRRRAGSSIPGDREYAIKHAVTREVAYDGLPKTRRAQMHAAFAEWLERNSTAQEAFASLLAHHYAEAVRPEDADLAWRGREERLEALRGRALVWLRTATDLAIGRMEIDDGLALLRRAIDLETDPERLAGLWHTTGRACILKFDGEGFWTAMQAALEATSDPSLEVEVYADLAFQTAMRTGMWRTKPEDSMIAEWTERALAMAPAGSPQRARALLARTYLEPEGSLPFAEEILAIADATGDIELRSFAFDALAGDAMARGDYAAAAAWADRRLALLPEIADPDHVAVTFGWSQDALVYAGRLEDARACAASLVEVTRTLSAHHRLHAAANVVRNEVIAGNWERARNLTATTEAAVAANAATPCALENLALLECALAHVRGGNDEEARRLEGVVESLGKKGFMLRIAIDVEIAIARGDLNAVARILEDWRPEDLVDVEGLVAWLNASMALGRRDPIVDAAPRLAIEGSYLEPFALRALGWARDEPALIERAVERFEAMGMTWFADQTRRPGS